MKFSVFNPFPTYGLGKVDWPTPPRLAHESDVVRDGFHKALEFSRRADEVGFDGVTVAEHHYSSKQLSPNPIIAGLAVANVLENASLSVLGCTLPLLNPLRTAEELAMLDGLTGGKLMVGFFRGVPFEYLTYGTNPWESREVFEEALALIRRAWSEPEPFGWLGRHFDYRTVSVWPQPIQGRDLPILISVGNPGAAAYAAQEGFIAGFAWAPTHVVRGLADAYRSEAASIGRVADPDDMLYRCFALAAPTDELADEWADTYSYGDHNKGFVLRDPDLVATVGSAIRGETPTKVASPLAFARPQRPIFIGSPETVTRQIREFIEETGVGRIELTLNDALLPYDLATESLNLIGTEVLPAVRESVSFAGV